jgi:hypothetical protein
MQTGGAADATPAAVTAAELAMQQADVFSAQIKARTGVLVDLKCSRC